MQLSPLALFVFNRPKHTKEVIQALLLNKLIEQTQIYIFSDQANVGNEENKRLVQEVRIIIKSSPWHVRPIIIERSTNFGLAKNIISGINYVLEKHDDIIVLEDDIITSPGFLEFMNNALDLYRDDQEVMHISGYMFPLKKKLPETFFYNTASCWGWGTWKNSWNKYEPDTAILLSHFKNEQEVYRFNIENSYNFHQQLVANHVKTLNTWAVKWYATIFNNDGFSLHPGKSLTKNIGHDGSGINSSIDESFENDPLAKSVKVERINITESSVVRKLMKQYYSVNKTKYSRSFFASLLSKEAKEFVKSTLSAKERDRNLEIKRLKNFPRYIPSKSTLLNFEISFNDSASFLFNYLEIFEQKVYDFESSKESPRIIDAGANIGLATLRFKMQHQNAKVIAIEADEEIIGHLESNIKSASLKNVQVIQAALWKTSGLISFDNSGADSGKVNPNDGNKQIKAILLSDLITENTDLIKIDIEGAELEVLKEAKHKLHLVKRLFIEFHSFINHDQNLAELLGILESTGFRYYISSPGVSRNNPFISATNQGYMGMDFQLNIHAIRE